MELVPKILLKLMALNENIKDLVCGQGTEEIVHIHAQSICMKKQQG